jgi:hypothetical protein
MLFYTDFNLSTSKYLVVIMCTLVYELSQNLNQGMGDTCTITSEREREYIIEAKNNYAAN